MAKPDFPRRPGDPEDISVDPTVLIDRASRKAAPGPVDQTIIIQRPDSGRRPRDEAARSAPPGSEAAETVVRRPAGRVPPQSRAGRPVNPAQPVPRPSRGWLPGKSGRSRPSPEVPSVWARADVRGAVLAIAAVAAAGLLVAGGWAAWRWLTPEGHLLTVTKPDHGSVVAEGIECGSRGDACSVSVAKGRRIELATEADTGYVFVGFSGDCANGWVVMGAPRTCVASFRQIGQPAPSGVMYTLTIDRPAGGTIQAVGGIECGLMGSSCSTELANGVAVELHARPETGYQFQNYTGDCLADGHTRMIAARRCGAVFAPKAAAPPPTVTDVGPPRKAREPELLPTGKVASLPPPPAQSSGVPPGTPPTGSQSPAPGSTGSQEPVIVVSPTPPSQTAEEHAKEEIQDLVVRYCAALMTRNPAEVRKLHPGADVEGLKTVFKELRSLKCSTGPVEYIALHPQAAGSATIKFPFKQERLMSSNGAPNVKETIVTMRLARESFSSHWLIDYVRHELKQP